MRKHSLFDLQLVISISDDDDKEDKVRYENIIFILKELEKSGSYTYSDGGWGIEYSYTAEEKRKIIDKMMEYHSKRSHIKCGKSSKLSVSR